MSNHVMFDLETLSTRCNAVVMSIGACEFFPERSGEDFLGRKFYVNLEVDAQIAKGLHVCSDTVMWWMKQSDAARKAFLEGGSKSTRYGLEEFSRWLCTVGVDEIWSHASFDQPILNNLYDVFGLDKPYSYRAPRDIRTLQMLMPDVPLVRTGEHHNALDDAVTQARWVSKALQALRG